MKSSYDIDANARYEITSFYADNKKYMVELRISLPSGDWDELKGQNFFKRLMRFIDKRSETRTDETQEEKR